MPESAVCRSSAGCSSLATDGTFGRYFCRDHFEEIDLLRRQWFSADGTPLRTQRDPAEAPLSIGEIADRFVEVVRQHHPQPVVRRDVRRALDLPHATVIQAATIASNRRRVISTNGGYALADAT